ncbi:ABC transporter ATP-binding protein [Marinisporobacter balticus]|uniref:ABC-2 type transport system ATP-binding protein n=1 Tax=Marinisporobacter balticus TaxID=2018667 RepID=A0A4R2KYP3_9FIRM|nr:ABC transporter ATP-binding protein [Marinisporobacter balticus]TCO78027.1 ABC-2 type transport system ATP-binding protein [Marinisporobacter balticus]
MENILEIKNVTKTFKGFELKNIGFHLEKGYIMGFIGPNGAGKTTTIKLIMNLIKRDTGIIKVFGLDNIKDEQCIKNRVGFVYGENYFYDELSLLEMKKIVAPFYSSWDDKQFYHYINKFNLPLNKKIKALSKGMRMKFALVLALSHNAEFIIMDEPTSGLDPVFRNELLGILYDLMQDENKGILFSTHITTDLDKIADYITFINNGEIIFSEQKDALLESYAIIKGSNEILDKDIMKEFVGVKENRFGFEALTKDIEKARQIFKNRVIIEKPSLEDIILYTVRGNV